MLQQNTNKNHMINGEFYLQGAGWIASSETGVIFENGHCVMTYSHDALQEVILEGSKQYEFSISTKISTVSSAYLYVFLEFPFEGGQFARFDLHETKWKTMKHIFTTPAGPKIILRVVLDAAGWPDVQCYFDNVEVREI